MTSGPDRRTERAGGLGVLGGIVVFAGLAMFGASFTIDDEPSCDGKAMSRTDACYSTSSGTRDYDEIVEDDASTKSNLQTWGPVAVVAGLVVVVGATVTSSTKN